MTEDTEGYTAEADAEPAAESMVPLGGHYSTADLEALGAALGRALGRYIEGQSNSDEALGWDVVVDEAETERKVELNATATQT